MSVQDDGGWARDGLTIRDYFAANALQGMLSDPELGDRWPLTEKNVFRKGVAETAYGYADAMLEARK